MVFGLVWRWIITLGMMGWYTWPRDHPMNTVTKQSPFTPFLATMYLRSVAHCLFIIHQHDELLKKFKTSAHSVGSTFLNKPSHQTIHVCVFAEKPNKFTFSWIYLAQKNILYKILIRLEDRGNRATHIHKKETKQHTYKKETKQHTYKKETDWLWSHSWT